ncbi:MAG: DNA-binding protein [Bacteroides sp.]
MIAVSLLRYARRKKLGDDKSPLIYLLKQKAGDSKVYTIDMLANEIESIGSLSAEDVSHVMQSFVRAMKKVLVSGNRLKVNGLGTFFLTLTCTPAEVEKDCTVKNVKRVNIRFWADSTLRLVNDSVATTRSGANNVCFEIVNPEAPATGGGGTTGGGTGGSGETPFS